MTPADSAGRPALAARVHFSILFAVAIALAIYVAWPFRVALLLALALASVLFGVYSSLVRLLRGRRAVAALLSTFGLLIVIIGPLAAVLGFVAGQLVVGLAFVRDQLGISSVDQLRRGALSANGERVLDRSLRALHISRSQFVATAGDAVAGAQHVTEQFLKTSSEAALHTAIMLMAFYFFLIDGERLIGWIEGISPLERHQTRDLLTEFRSVSRASIFGAGVGAIFQGVAAAIGFLITGVPYAVFFGLLTLLASLVPVVGTLLVWVPAVALLWISGHHAAAVVLCVWCLVFVVGAVEVGKPFVMRAILRGGEPMHTGLVFLSLLGGIEMFGLVGIVAGPLGVAFFLAMVRIYERDFRAARVVAP